MLDREENVSARTGDTERSSEPVWQTATTNTGIELMNNNDDVAPHHIRTANCQLDGTLETSAQQTPVTKQNGVDEDALLSASDENGQFSLEKVLSAWLEQVQQHGKELRTVGVGWRRLTVTGAGAGVREQATVGTMLLPHVEAFRLHKQKPVKTILDSLSGTLMPGEMLLVLGRPGAGCTSLLKTLASYRDGFHSIQGDLTYTGLTVKDIEGKFRGDVVFAPEDDIHFPTLTVKQTLAFAAAMRTPQAKSRFPLPVTAASTKTSSDYKRKNSRKEYYRTVMDILATILGLKHTYNTKVGNDTIRGVSGGERKRVTVAETLASHGKLVLFDNSSRGLDSSTALDFVQSLRLFANSCQIAIGASLYQAGDNITNQFDKVLVLNKGRQAFFGHVHDAVPYFESLGFHRQNRQTIADFLVACASGQASTAAAGVCSEVALPITPEAQKLAWEMSSNATQVNHEVDQFFQTYDVKGASSATRNLYREQLQTEKATTARSGSSYTLSIPMQIRWAVKRRVQILANDRATQVTPMISAVFQSIILGTVFLDMPADSANTFSRGSVLFSSLLIMALNAMAEITRCYAQRPIVIRHRRFGFLHPFADAFGDLLIDLPAQCIGLIVFSLVLYFMTGLARSASQFFVFYFTTLLVVLTMSAFFRMLAAIFRHESRAIMFAGVAVLILIVYTGYIIPRPTMRGYWRWLSYANPAAFGFEILLANEFRRLKIKCTGMVPNGAGYESVSVANQVCPMTGAEPGQSIVDGQRYLEKSFGYRWSNAPRNASILIAFWLTFVAILFVAAEMQQDPFATGSVMIFKRSSAAVSSRKRKDKPETELDAEKAEAGGDDAEQAHQYKPERISAMYGAQDPDDDNNVLRTITTSRSSIFSWRDVSYDVQIKSEKRRLLRNVSGFVLPGKMTALMGESGAGKTTLLNVLAQRTDTGIVSGRFLVDGSVISPSFQRSTGYCQQQDIHLNTQTVREALQFSALLRRPASVPREEKLSYVEYVIKLLEMESFSDAIVGQVGEGLNLEQRKLLTVGVELAAKPQLLIFLDEPTSGLDSTAAWSIIRLLKKLARTGQAILCTIHQPSGELFNQFDSLLLLQKGGRTVFFGETGENSCKLIEYFESISGQKCGANHNPAEYILDVIGAGATATSNIDWHGAFLQSHLHRALQESLNEIDKRAGQARNTTEEDDALKYAMPFWFQLGVSLKRIFVHYQRSTTYISSKVGLNLISGVFLGTSFWGRGKEDSISSINNKVFSVFMALCSAAPLSQQLQPVFIQFRTLYEAREKPSMMYSWPVAVLTPMLVEVPWNMLGASVFWLIWYWMTRFPSGKSAAIVWGVHMMYQFFFASLSQWLAAMARNSTMASLLFTAMFSFIIMFCGVLQPPQSLPKFWRSWMYHISPLTYAVEGYLAPIFGDRPVRCKPSELFTLIPPTGQSCDTFLSNFTVSLTSLNQATANTGSTFHGTGYYAQLQDGSCGYCQFRDGTDYLNTVEQKESHWKRDLVILAAFVVLNYALCLASFYVFRVANIKLPSLPIKVAKTKSGEKTRDKDDAPIALQTPFALTPPNGAS